MEYTIVKLTSESLFALDFDLVQMCDYVWYAQHNIHVTLRRLLQNDAANVRRPEGIFLFIP